MSSKLKRKIIYNVTSSIRTNLRTLVLGLSLQRQMTMVNSNSRKDKETQIIEKNSNHSNNVKAEIVIINMMEDVDKSMAMEVINNLSKTGKSGSTSSSTRDDTSTKKSEPTITGSDEKTDEGEMEASINTNSTFSANHPLAIRNGLIESLKDDDGNDLFLVQDGANYKDTDENRSYYAVQLSTTLHSYETSMLTTEDHEGENDNKEVRYNKYFNMVGKFKAHLDKHKIKVMTSKKGQQKVIQSDLLFGGHSNNEFKNGFKYSLEQLRGGGRGEGFKRNFKVNVYVQAVYGYRYFRNKIFDFLNTEKIWMHSVNGPIEIVKQANVGYIAGLFTGATYLPHLHTKINTEAQAEYYGNKTRYKKFNLDKDKALPYITLEDGDISEPFSRNRKMQSNSNHMPVRICGPGQRIIAQNLTYS